MASFEFKLPDIGEGVSEGEIVDWHVGVGDSVEEDDPMVEVMTDKATVTIGAPKAGTIQDLRFDVGAVAQVGQVIVVIDTAGGAVAEAAPEAKGDDDEGPAATAVGAVWADGVTRRASERRRSWVGGHVMPPGAPAACHKPTRRSPAAQARLVFGRPRRRQSRRRAWQAQRQRRAGATGGGM